MSYTKIVLAAGQGTRMKSSLPKVMHKICGLTLAEHVLAACQSVEGETVTVIGNGSELVRAALNGKTAFAVQEQRLGTGHAVMQCFEQCDINSEYTLVCAGDMPLITGESLQKLCAEAEGKGACVLTACLDDPTGYGRVIREEDRFKKIVEHRDATAEELKINEVNTSVYVFKTELLKNALKHLTPKNAQGEYYLTDCVEIISRRAKVGIYCLKDATEAMGINDRVQLAQAAEVMRGRINDFHMKNGVTFTDPRCTYVDAGVVIGRDTVIYPGNQIGTGTVIGAGCTLNGASRIENSVIGDGVAISASTLLECQVGDGTTVGPNAYLRPNARVGKGARIGDFVEIKNAVIGDGTKVSHLSYVGDADIGEKCNIGCGAVFVNYDGKHKYRTTVGSGVFVGSNANIVAPVNLADGAYIAAGSTITKDIPAGALAVARSKEYIKEEWASNLRAKWEKEGK